MICPIEFLKKQGEEVEDMNGESKRSFAVAVVSFSVGAVLACILGNSATRSKLTEGSKKLLRLSSD